MSEEWLQQNRIAEVATRLAEAYRAELQDDEKTKRIADHHRDLESQTKRLEEIRLKAPGVRQPHTGKFMKPQSLDRVELQFEPGSDPRGPFVNWALSHENFSGAMVNRLWKHFFVVGLVEPVDDLRASNPPSNAALWKVLHEEFRSHNYDLRGAIRLILNARVSQIKGGNGPIFSLAFTADGKQIATGGYDGRIRFYKTNNGETVNEFDSVPLQ